MIHTIICESCGTPGVPIKKTKGSFFIELILWLCLIIPGLIYSIWRLTTKYKVCRTCGSTAIVPIDTPKGRGLAKQYNIDV